MWKSILLCFLTLHFTHGADEWCKDKERGVYPLPPDCSQYVMCQPGMETRLSCPPGLIYDSSKQVCEFSHSVACQFISVDDEPANNGEAIAHTTKQEAVTPASPTRPRRQASFQDSSELVNIQKIEEDMEDTMKEAKEKALEILHHEAKMAKSMPRYRTTRPFHRVQGFLGATKFVKQMSLPALVELQALSIIRHRYGLRRHQMRGVLERLKDVLKKNKQPVEPDGRTPAVDLDTCPFPDNSEDNNCNGSARYRTYDGTCNNLQRPLWGRSFRPLQRFLSPVYADGIEAPRVATDGSELPSARLVSWATFAEKDKPDHVHTLLHMTWGQFLDHDLSRTAVAKLNTDHMGEGNMVDIECGEDGCRTEGIENRQCLPIAVPMGDPDFPDKKCLMFVRSQEAPPGDCHCRGREQFNQLTSHLDASMIYGSTMEDSQALRDLTDSTRGRLKMSKHPSSKYRDLLPHWDDPLCRNHNETIRCFIAGDSRVNEQAGLMTLHTIFARYHNVIEERLHKINPEWTGETLFQETKKIVTAAWQHQIFNEYLPLVLGTHKIHQYGLKLQSKGYWDGYDSSVNPEVANVFATAAFRFGHSSVQSFLTFQNQNYSRKEHTYLSSVFNRPYEVYSVARPGGSGIDSIILGQVSQPMQTIDAFFSKQITAKLFSEKPPTLPGTDLISLNMQRGRDHGIPGYPAWRKWCGLSVPNSFNEITDIPADVVMKLSTLYKHVDDIDVYAAGVAESHVPGGVVGPTFACIIGRQFRSLRVGDRFWYETSNPYTGFTPGQLSEIRKASVARVICDTLDHVDTIQPYVFLQPISQAFANIGGRKYEEIYSLASLYHGEDNERRSCDQIPDIDLSKWRL